MSATRPDTWMPLYVADYLADTTRLTTAQHGAYLLLIMAYWRAGEALADDDDDLAAITRQPVKDWQRMRPKIAPFFNVIDGMWCHRRIEVEIERAMANRAQKETAGKASARQRTLQRESNGRSTSVATGPATEPQRKLNSSPSPSQKEEDSVANATGADAPPPTESDLVWGDGLTWLASAEGKAAGPLRSMVGRWCKVYGDGHVLAVLGEARSQSPPVIGPVAWIEAALKTRNRSYGRANNHQPVRNGFAAIAISAAHRRADRA